MNTIKINSSQIKFSKILFFAIVFLLGFSSCLYAQDKSWKKATHYPGSKIVFEKVVNFSEYWERSPYNHNIFYNDPSWKKSSTWDKVKNRVTRTYYFKLTEPGYLTAEYGTHVDKGIFYHERPKFYISRDNNGKWENVFLGRYTIETNFKGNKAKDTASGLAYKVKDDGTLQFYLAPGFYPPGNYRVHFVSATRSGAYDLAYVQSKISLKVYLLKKGAKVTEEPNATTSKPKNADTIKPPAIITSIQGDEVEVDVNGDGHFVKAAVGMELKEKSVIITGMDTKVRVDFGRRGTVTVNELTSFSIKTYIMAKDGITADTSLRTGGVDVEVDRNFKEIDFSVSTPTCVSSVRGTVFHVSHRHHPEKTTVCVDRGKVEVTPRLFSVAPRIIHPGECITVDDRGFGKATATGNTKSTIKASADAYVYAYNYRNWNRSNRGKYDQLVMGWHPAGGESRAYIKFDLSHIDTAQINKAVLKLFHFQTKLGNSIDLGVYRVTSPWEEGTDTYHSGRTEKTAAPGELSWVQQPSIDATPVATFNPGSGLYDWTKIDITPLVKKWLSGTPNYGLVVKPLSHRGGSVYYFASRERSTNLDRPKGKSKAPVLIFSENTNTNNIHTDIPSTTTGAKSNHCPSSKQEAYNLYVYNFDKLNELMNQGHGDTKDAQVFYQKYKFYKDCYTNAAGAHATGSTPEAYSTKNQYGTISPNGEITIITYHTSPKGTGHIAYTSLLIKDKQNIIYVQDPYKTFNQHTTKPIPNNHFGVYPTEKSGYTVKDLIDAGRSGAVSPIRTRYSTILSDTYGKVVGDKIEVVLHLRLNNFPAGKKYIYARTVDLDSIDSGWKKVGEFNVAKKPDNYINSNCNHKYSYSCKNKDNTEKGCCCFMGTHTYKFSPRFVASVETEFDTGRQLDCRSIVRLEIYQGNSWELAKSIQANSSKNGSETAPKKVNVPVGTTIGGFRISDGCVCCIDDSKIILHDACKAGRNSSATNYASSNTSTMTGDITGKWRWFDGSIIHFYKNGTCKGRLNGAWKAAWNGNHYLVTVNWNNGQWTDTLVLRGDTLDGHNQNGTHVWGKKIGNNVPIIPRKNGVQQSKVSHSNTTKTKSKASLFQQYLGAKQKLENLMSRGLGDTPEAQQAYKRYKETKDAYNKTLKRK